MLQYTGEETIGISPPVIPSSELGQTPTPVDGRSILGNVRNRAITNTTFSLFTTATVPVGANVVMPLHTTTQAKRAILVVEAAPGTPSNTVIARCWMDGSFPTPERGLQFRDGGVIEITSAEDILNFRIITCDNRPHIVQVQYFA